MPAIAEEPEVPTMAHVSTNVPISAAGAAPADVDVDPAQAGGDDFLDLDNDSAHARGAKMLHDMGDLAHEVPDMPDAFHLTASTGRREDAMPDHVHDHSVRGSSQDLDSLDRDDYSSTRVGYGSPSPPLGPVDSPPISVRSLPSLGETVRTDVSDISSVYKDPATKPTIPGKRIIDTMTNDPMAVDPGMFNLLGQQPATRPQPMARQKPVVADQPDQPMADVPPDDDWSVAPRGMAPRAGRGRFGFTPHPNIPFPANFQPTADPTLPGTGGLPATGGTGAAPVAPVAPVTAPVAATGAAAAAATAASCAA